MIKNTVNSKEVEANSEENKRKKELEKILFNSSPILRNSPRPVEVYEEKGNLARRSLFFFYSPSDIQQNKKFVYLMKKVFLRIDPDAPGFDIKGIEFRERTNKSEKVRERIENICVKEFVKDLEKKYLVEKLCDKIDSENTKSFKELKIEDSKLFFENIFKYIDKLGAAKDILIIADRKTYRFIKQNETGKFLESYIGNLLETDLENNIRLIMVSQKRLLIPYYIDLITDNDYHKPEKNYHYLNISYEIDLMDSKQIIVFKE